MSLSYIFILKDPFETGIGESPNDLGSNLTFKGQAKVFKYLRMAYFALAGMIVHPKGGMSYILNSKLLRGFLT